MLGTIVLATITPAIAAALVIFLIPPRILGRMGKALSLVATGLLLTLALTHLIPEAIEEGSDIHDIGLTIWGTIMVLVAIEMFFNSNHHSATCPVCHATKETRAQADAHAHAHDSHDHSHAHSAAHNHVHVNAASGLKISSIKSHVVHDGSAPASSLESQVNTFNAYHHAHGECNDPNCSCHDHEHSHEHAHGELCSCGQVHEIDPDHPDNRSTLHHLAHSHGFTLRGRDIEEATKRAQEMEALGKGSVKEGLSKGGAPILAGSLFHSLCDGIVMASAFLVDFNVGVAITAAIIAHEMPQQISNYVLMLNFGMSRKQGFIVNLTAMIGSLAGGIICYNILDKAESLLPFALAIAGGSFIYVALSDILPRLNKPENKCLMFLSFGYLVIGALIAMMLSHHH